jgi:hypothetical protein
MRKSQLAGRAVAQAPAHGADEMRTDQVALGRAQLAFPPRFARDLPTNPAPEPGSLSGAAGEFSRWSTATRGPRLAVCRAWASRSLSGSRCATPKAGPTRDCRVTIKTLTEQSLADARARVGRAREDWGAAFGER